MNKIFKLILGNIAILFILMVIVEIALRLLGIGYGSSPFEQSQVLHHCRPKNYEFTVYDPINNEFGEHKVLFDQHGYRYDPESISTIPKNPALTIAFIGDSFVESNQSTWDSTYIGTLQRIFPAYEFKNFGIGSYCPSIYYLQLKHFILSPLNTKPDIVIMVLYSNDVGADDRYLKKGEWNSKGELESINGGNNDWLVRFLRKSYLARLIRRCQLIIHYRKNKKPSVKELIADGIYEEVPVFEGSNSEKYTLLCAELCKKNNIEFFLTAIPSIYSHFTNNYAVNTFAHGVRESAEKHQINYIDLIKPFKEYSLASNKTLFFPIDRHLNDNGQQLVAKIMAQYFRIELCY